MQVHIGCTGFPYSQKHYVKNFNFVELQDSYTGFVRRKTLASLREQVGEDFVFSMRAPIYLMEDAEMFGRFIKGVPQIDPEKLDTYGSFQQTDENLKLLNIMLHEAENLNAKMIVFYTTNKIYPTDGTIKKINSFFKVVQERMGDQKCHIVWNPIGFWQKDTILEAIKGTSVIPSFDPIMEEEPYGDFPINYYVLRGLGLYARGYSDEVLDQLAESIDQEDKDTYVVFQGQLQASDAKRFKEIF